MSDLLLTVSTSIPAATGAWANAYFRKVEGQKGVYRLGGIPFSLQGKAAGRLYLLGCTHVAAGCTIHNQAGWLDFECSLTTAGYLAQIFHTHGEPLLVSKKTGKILSGMAVTRSYENGCKDVFIQRVQEVGTELRVSEGEQEARNKRLIKKIDQQRLLA